MVPGDQTGILRFERDRCPIEPSFRELPVDGLMDERMGMAEDQGPVGHAAIDQYLTIYRGNLRSVTRSGIERIGTDCPYRAAHSPGHQSFCQVIEVTALHLAIL